MRRAPALHRYRAVAHAAAVNASSHRPWLRALEATSSAGQDTSRTFGEVLNDLASRFASAPALIDDNGALSFDGLAKRANRYGSWARTQGFVPGTVVALLMQNCTDYVAIWAGLGQAGCTVALLNTNLARGALAHAVRAAGARTLIVETALQDLVLAIEPDFPGLSIWCHGKDQTLWPRVDLAIAGEPDTRPEPVQNIGKIPALLIYTSGTTGMPKAAIVSHARILQWSYWFAGMMGTQPTDRLYNCLPLYHSTGGVCAIGAALVNGGSVYIRRRFSVQKFWSEICDSGSTIFQYIGELCRYLLRAPQHPQETEHNLRLCCGNGLREEVWRGFEARFGIPRIIEFYAMTEGAVSLFNCEGRPGAIGRVPSYLAHRFAIAIVRCDPESGALIRDAAGQCIPCAPGEIGEALGRLDTDSVSPARGFDGYTDTTLTSTKLARAVFRADDLWYRTGDLMRRDEEGFYYFVDRLGDAFRWKGENVSASEVAAIISSARGVADAVVYGVRIPGQEGRAGMAAIAGAEDFSLAELRRHVQETLPSYARPVFVRICSSIDRTGTFKLTGGAFAVEGYSGTPMDQLWFDDRDAQLYIPCTEELLASIENGSRIL